MVDKCKIGNCTDFAETNCSACGQPTCRRHGRAVGDKFICRECADRAR